MAYKIKIKHNCLDRTLKMTLVYDDPNRELPEIPVNMTNEFQTVSLAGWGLTPDDMDVNKIKIKESSVEDRYAIYNIRNVYISPET